MTFEKMMEKGIENGFGKHATAHDVVQGLHMTGKVVIITSGDTGIGFQTSLALAQIGAVIVITSRNSERAENAAESIRQAVPGSTISVVSYLELTRFEMVRAAAQQLATLERIDVLLCNSGGAKWPGNLMTSDGFETTMQVNALSHILLIELLLPKLRSSNGKVIFTSSGACHFAGPWSGLDDDCVQTENIVNYAANGVPGGDKKSPVHGWFQNSYGLSKHVQTVYVEALSKNEPLISAYAVHPGVVDTDAISQFSSETICSWTGGEAAVSAAHGASSGAFLAATDPSKLFNGRFYFLGTPVPSLLDNMTSTNGLAWASMYTSSVYSALVKLVTN